MAIYTRDALTGEEEIEHCTIHRKDYFFLVGPVVAVSTRDVLTTSNVNCIMLSEHCVAVALGFLQRLLSWERYEVHSAQIFTREWFCCTCVAGGHSKRVRAC